ncbi:MAG: hypothetical protein SWY16_00305 [Cyanobacteriota bacterium]|nr:hypothetical protein [Cyanobacteriota bacterium]
MSDVPSSDRIEIENENALAELLWEIDASQGLFKPMLAHCNYSALRHYLVGQLRQRSQTDIREIVLHPATTKLYSTLRAEIGDDKPSAAMVFGLEAVRDLDRLLSLANWMRNEFQAQCPYPLVLWVNDDVVARLIRLAPDFADFCTSAEFAIAPRNLVYEIRKASDRLFSVVLATGADRFPTNQDIFGNEYLSEVNAALRELEGYGLSLPPELHASYLFAMGRAAYLDDKMEEALDLYDRSLEFWQQAARTPDLDPTTDADYQLKIGVLLCDMGLCYARRGQLYRGDSREHWQEARSQFAAGIEAFEKAQRPDIAANFIPRLGKILGQLEAWDELAALAKKSQQLHQTYGSQAQLAGDFGFLAQVALHRQSWERAKELATSALQIVRGLPKRERLEKGRYELLLGRAQRHLGQLDAALESLERARDSQPAYDPLLYIEILNELRSLYYDDLQDYVQAFQVRQDRRSIERQFGFRAFLGPSYLRPHKRAKSLLDRAEALDTIPQEIIASGRQKDVERLVARIGSTQHKLTIVYGQSGVGKSSLIQAGLIPALQPQTFFTRDVAIVTLRVYTNWERELGKRLEKTLAFFKIKRVDKIGSIDQILNQLQANETSNLLTVLIFDQFEEFFFTCPNSAERKTFLNFLGYALNIPFVKAVISLREDYLHYLSIANRLPSMNAISNDILSRNILYYLGNFSPTEAKDIVISLTQSSQFPLEPDLIDAFVNELAAEAGEVRPVELQIVGAQLQTEEIVTLEQYRELGSKDKLVERYLEDVIEDCGDRHEKLARLVLYLLTDENNTRPLKTRTELAKDSLIADANFARSNLDLVLTIFAESGLIFVLPETPEDRYQLVHDYLAKFIRQQQGPQLTQLREELDRANEEKKRSERQLDRLLKSTLVLFAALTTVSLGLWRQAETQKRIAEFREASANVKAIFATRELEALVEGMKVGQQLYEDLQSNLQQQLLGPLDAKTKMQTVTMLREIVYGAKTRNQLDARGGVADISFSPDGQTIVAFSSLEGIQFWNWQGRVLQTIPIQTAGVNAVKFSPDGRTLALTLTDGTLELWDRQGRRLQTFRGGNGRREGLPQTQLRDRQGGRPQTFRGGNGQREGLPQIQLSRDGQTLAILRPRERVELWQKDGEQFQQQTEYAIRPGETGALRFRRDGNRFRTDGTGAMQFSGDGNILAIGHGDGTVDLRSRDGALLRTFAAQDGGLDTIGFSRDDRTLATVGGDGTVKLWQSDGRQIATLKATDRSDSALGANRIRFSPNEKILATGDFDGNVRLWNQQGQLTTTFTEHQEAIAHLSFSPDGQTIASTSEDNTVRLWNLEGEQLHVLTGQGSGVLSGYFSPTGETLAIANSDGTIQLVDLRALKSSSLETLERSEGKIDRLRFSPDDRTIATVGDDGRARLWDRNGELLHVLDGGDANGGNANENGEIIDFNFAPDGILATVGDDNRVRFWNRQGEPLETQLETVAPEIAIDRVGFAANDRLITMGENDRSQEVAIALWELDGTLRQILTVGDGAREGEMVLSPNGRILAVADDNYTVQLWFLSGADVLEGPRLSGHRDRITSISFSPDSQLVATASADSTAKLWNRQGEELEPLLGHGDEVTGIGFSPNGQTIATASRDRTVKLWNRQGQSIDTLIGHGDEVTQVEFSHDGRTLASVGNDGKVILWNLDLNDLLNRGCRWLENYLIAHPEDLAELEICQTDTRLAQAAEAWVQQGTTLARQGDRDEAIDAFETANTWNRDLNLDPDVAAAPAGIIKGEDLAMDGRIDAAIAEYERARTLNPSLDVPARSWESLCWFGSLDHRAPDVLDACDRAVALDPHDWEIRISRGLARGLSGNSSGAIEDFQAALDEIDLQDDGEEHFPRVRSRLNTWIASLKAGNDPFSDRELEDLKNDW